MGPPVVGARAFRVGMKRSAILASAVAAAVGGGAFAAGTASCAVDETTPIAAADAYGIAPELDAAHPDVVAVDAAYGIPFDGTAEDVLGGGDGGADAAPGDAPVDAVEEEKADAGGDAKDDGEGEGD